METLNAFMGSMVVAPWEFLCFVAVAGIYTYLGRRKSVLQVTFIFTFYWGFNNLLAILSRSTDGSQSTVLLYVGCGLAVFGLMSANYLMKKMPESPESAEIPEVSAEAEPVEELTS